MHSVLGSQLGRRGLYTPTTGIVSIAANWKQILRFKVKDFVEGGTPLEKVSSWPETVFA
jgi:hypothetical protein